MTAAITRLGTKGGFRREKERERERERERGSEPNRCGNHREFESS